MGICVSCRRRDRKAPEKRAPGAGGARLPAKGAAAELLPRRASDAAMANSISNIKMTNPIKGIVSKRRKRYIKDGFNLDLAYITDRLIAMGFPAENLEGYYRNHIDEVYRFLEKMHKDHYRIYNLCSERSYDTSKFHERVVRYAFDDHAPPNIELIKPFCEDVHGWLTADPRNVAAVHCKAGKGRTGTMVCCYLLYSGQKATADEALQFYGTKRTYDEKGVTIPSQRRYVEYFAALVRSGLDYSATRVHIRELIMSPPPTLNGGQCSLELTVSQAQPPLEAPAGCHEIRRHEASVRVVLTQCTPLSGDVRVDVYKEPKMMRKEKRKLFHFWFNTFFVAHGVGAVRVPPPADSMNLETYKLTLNKWQLDNAHKDTQHKLYSADFKVELIVQKQPDTSTFRGQSLRAPSPPSSSDSSCSEPDTEPDAHWDSGESPLYRVPYTRLQEPYDITRPCSDTQSQIRRVSSPFSETQSQTRRVSSPFSETQSQTRRVSSPFSETQSQIRRISSAFSETQSQMRLVSSPYSDTVSQKSCVSSQVGPYSETQSQKSCISSQMGPYSETQSQIRRVSSPYSETRSQKSCISSQMRPFSETLSQTRGLSSPAESLTESQSQSHRNSPSEGSYAETQSQTRLTSSPMEDEESHCQLRRISSPEGSYDSQSKMRFIRSPSSDSSMKVDEFQTFPSLSDSDKSMMADDRYMQTESDSKSTYIRLSDPTDSRTKVESLDDDQIDQCSCYIDKNVRESSRVCKDKSEASALLSENGKDTKKHANKRDDDKNEKGKIPKVSSDHTISDGTKKKYTLFHKKDEDRMSKPRLSLGDVRASWREFSGKFGSDHRKKKDREDSS